MEKLTFEEMRTEVLRHYHITMHQLDKPGASMRDVDWWSAQASLAYSLGLITHEEKKQMNKNVQKAWKESNTSKLFPELYANETHLDENVQSKSEKVRECENRSEEAEPISDAEQPELDCRVRRSVMKR